VSLKKPEEENGKKKLTLTEYLKKSKTGAYDEIRTQRKLRDQLNPPVVPVTPLATKIKQAIAMETARKITMITVRRKSKLFKLSQF